MPFDADNPLLHPSPLSQGAPPFADIRPDHFRPAFQFAISAARQSLETIATNPATATFENTVEAIDFSNDTLGRISNIFNALASVRHNDVMEAIKAGMGDALIAHENAVIHDARLFARVKAVYDARAALSLDDEQRMLLERTYRRFIRNGTSLDPGKKRQLLDIEQKLAAKTKLFADNLHKAGEASAVSVTDENDLADVPDRLKAIYKEAAEEKGNPDQWLIEMSPPPEELLEYCSNRTLREKVYRAMHGRAFGGIYDNRPVILDMIRLRHQKAQILGYKNYAAFALADRMAGDVATVESFLEKTGAVYKQEMQKVLRLVALYARRVDGIQNLEPWDFDYYHRRLQEETFDVNVEEIRAYFPLGGVRDGMFAHAKKLFGIEFREEKGKYPAYAPGVTPYEVTDIATGAVLGVLYFDPNARPSSKEGGAYTIALRERGTEEGQDACPLVIVSLDLPRATRNRPTLLAMEDIETLFHEFGHALHSLLATGRYPSQNGTNVTLDFMEVPSQVQENWARSVDVLMTFARHWKTGAPPPRTLLEKYVAHEKAHAIHTAMHVHFLSQLDLTWHSTDPATIQSVEQLEDVVRARHWIFPRADSGSTSTHFDHLEDYAAGYYSYPYNAMLDADIFSLFQAQGLYDPGLAARLRELYAKGANANPMDIFTKMCGRKPDPAALLKRDGAIAP